MNKNYLLLDIEIVVVVFDESLYQIKSQERQISECIILFDQRFDLTDNNQLGDRVVDIAMLNVAQDRNNHHNH